MGIQRVVRGPEIWLMRLGKCPLQDHFRHSNSTIAPPTDRTLSPMTLLAYELACASADVTVVRTNKSSRLEDNKAAA